MSYPSVSFKPTSQAIGLQPIDATSTTQNHPLGMIVKAVDVTYGEGEFIYLTGVASTAKGDVVCFDQKAGTTVRAVHGGTGSNGPAGVAMSANVASQYGWYQIGGSTPVKAGTVAANTAAFMTSTAGTIDDAVVSGDRIDGMLIKAADSGNYATCQLDRPCAVGGGGEVTDVAQTIAGAKSFSGGVVLATSASRPTAAVGVRGMLWVVQGGAGVADILEVCIKKADDTYAWLTVTIS